MASKNQPFDVSLLKNIAKDIKSFMESNTNITTIKEVEKFCEEILLLNDEGTKTFSPEKSVKIRGALYAFIALNNYKAPNELQELLSQLSGVTSLGDASSRFSESYSRIYEIISKLPKRLFLESELYFANEDVIKSLLGIKDEFESLISTETQRRKLKFNSIVKIINTEAPSFSYEVSYKSKYQYVSKKESIEKYLPAHYEITKNKLVKDHEELLATHKFSSSKKEILARKLEAELKKIDDEFTYIMEHLEDEDFDVKIVSYEKSTIYPEIKYSLSSNNAKSKTQHIHLSKEVPNVLWYEPMHVKKSSTIEDILENYSHPFGNVYYSISKTPSSLR